MTDVQEVNGVSIRVKELDRTKLTIGQKKWLNMHRCENCNSIMPSIKKNIILICDKCWRVVIAKK
jgi:hypothetical protein